MKKETKYWSIFAGLFLLTLIFAGADPCSTDEYDQGLCDYNPILTILFTTTCLISLVPLGLAINEVRKRGGFSGNHPNIRKTVLVQKTPTQRIVRRTTRVIQNPISPAPISPLDSMPQIYEKPNIAQDRKQAHLDRAHKMELDGDLEGAITAYELAEEFKEAQRVKWALGNSKQGFASSGPSNVNISIGKVGDTSIQDSVVTGSNDDPEID